MLAHPHLSAVTASGELAPRRDSPIDVVLADDHALVRRSLRVLLDREKDVRVVAEATDLSGTLDHVERRAPRVLVLGLELSDRSGLDIIREVRAQMPKTEIVVLTMDPSPAMAERVFAAGGAGFVLTDTADRELPTAVRLAAAGQEYVSPRVEVQLDGLRHASGGSVLSPRETEVLRLLALGHTSAEIGAKLHLSRRTVETHRAHIHRKLGLRSRAELVQYALRRGLLTTRRDDAP